MQAMTEAEKKRTEEALENADRVCREWCRVMEKAQDEHGASSADARWAEEKYDFATAVRANLERKLGI